MTTLTHLALVTLASVIASGCHIGSKPPEFADFSGLDTNTAPTAIIIVGVREDANREEIVHALRTIGGVTEDNAQEIAGVLLSRGEMTLKGLQPDEAHALARALRSAGALVGNQYFYVLGEVKRPGPVPFLGQTTFTEAIDSAGGFTTAANRKRLEIRRSEGPTEHWSYYDIERMHTNAPLIFPGDILEVRRKRFVW